MPNDTKRGIGAVLVAMGAVGLLLWLAVARLSSDTALSIIGLAVAALLLSANVAGFLLIRKNR